MPDDVRKLVERSRAGEQPAMLTLVEHFQGRVFGLCYRMLGQRQDAEDAVQETFVRALRSLAGFDAERGFEPWLLAIASNRCRTVLARRRRGPAEVALDEPVCDAASEFQAARHLAEEVDVALAGLREEYRRAFLLFHEQELSYAEIGDLLDCPLGTVKTWVHRARHELMFQLRKRGVIAEVRDAVR